MSDFDVEGARKAGYSEGEIADHLGKQRGFDVGAARKAGYSDADILGHLTASSAAAAAPPARAPVAASAVYQGRPMTVAPVPPEAAASPPAAHEKPWADVAKDAVTNIPASAGHFANALVQPFLHPVDTLTTLGRVGEGIVSKGRALARNAVGAPIDVDRPTVEGPADAVGKFYADRYGSMEGFKNALATDPVGVAADIATVASGGTALPGRAGQIMGTVSRAADPITQAGNMLKTAGKGVEAVTSSALGMTTGTGKESVRAAARAGMEGGENAKAFTDSMRGNTPIEDVVSTAKSAVDQIRQERAKAYKEGMADVSKDKTVLDFQPIEDALVKATEVGTYKGKVVNRSAGETMDKVSGIVNEWKSLDPKEFHTPEGLDALKRTLGDLRDSTEVNTPARVAADKVYNAVRAEIASQAPGYAKVMSAYGDASEGLKEVTKTFSLGEKATGDTAARKLLSVTRNNAQTNYGQRTKLLDDLAEHEPTLPYQIAGQGMNALAPRGLVGRGGVMAAGGSMVANPGNALLLPAFSPRIVGEGAYFAGSGAGLAEKTLNALRINAENARRAGRAGYQTGRLQEAQ